MSTIVLRSLRLARMSTAAKPVMHEAIKPLSWLLGKWTSVQAKGFYPTLEDFTYTEELEFFHVGQPMIQFSWYSSHPEKGTPMHREVGFIRVKPGTTTVAVNCAHNIGLAEVEEGELSDGKLTLRSHTVGRLTFGKPPHTTKIRLNRVPLFLEKVSKTVIIKRSFTRQGDDGLQQVVSMETSKTSMTEHLRVEYKKIA